jgi:hypothetical protein
VDVGLAYLEIALRLRRLVPDWVDSYVGPPDLSDAVDRDPPPAAGELGEKVEELRQRVQEEEALVDRRAWLLAQLQGIATALRWLSDPSVDYSRRFALSHGARLEAAPETRFEAAHALLDGALPGPGDLSTRFQAWEKTQLVTRDRLHEGLELLGREMRRRCHQMFELPEDERVTWEVVAGARWLGHAEYLGERHTRIQINADIPISSLRLLELVCHEAYPGHHTDHVCKDVSLIHGAGRAELSVFVYPSPQALLSEGLASYAVEALLGEEADEAAARCLAPAGIAYDTETGRVVRQADELLLPVRSNIALMLDGGMTSGAAREYARAWMLEDAKHIEQAIDHLEAGSWLPYESCYPVGLELCRSYASAGGQFADLLHRQLTPADLAADLG